MDPDENLKKQRELVAEILHLADTDDASMTDSTTALGNLGIELAEHVAALDQWISRGGFIPARWKRR